MDAQRDAFVEELIRGREAGQRTSGPDGDILDDAIVKLVKRMPRIFRLPVPDAQGLVIVGGKVDGSTVDQTDCDRSASVTGTGFDLWHATTSCACEAIEFLSQLAPRDCTFHVGGQDGVRHGLDAEELSVLLAMAGMDRADSDGPVPWAEGRSLCDDTPVLVPAQLCYRNIERPNSPTPRVKLSTGCGAGERREAALLHALLELIERDAVSLWWIGGRRGRDLPISKESLNELLAPFGRDKSQRRCWLMDITTDLGVPCVAALSTDEQGRAFACGFAAHLTHGKAVTAAVREMCQMEVGLYLVLLKRRQDGGAALSEADTMHLRRGFGFNVSRSPLLFSEGTPRAGQSLVAADAISARELWRGLGGDVGGAYWTDLTRTDLGIPAVRALAPGLQPYPSDVFTARLQRQIAQSGGGPGLASGISLM
jgi:ribosomal protein S12 methylthiotransferase accessory factor